MTANTQRMAILLGECQAALESATRIVTRLANERELTPQDEQALAASANQARAAASALDKLSGMLWYHRDTSRTVRLSDNNA